MATQSTMLTVLTELTTEQKSQAQLVHSHTQSIAKIETQLGQLAQSMIVEKQEPCRANPNKTLEASL